jgi:hypothetical protein
MEGARDDLDESGQAKETNITNTSNGGNVVYTPASTVSSSKADSTYEEEDENSAQPAGENSRGVWNEWWKAEELAAQVGSLSKELLELKAMIEKQTFEEEANVSIYLHKYSLSVQSAKIMFVLCRTCLASRRIIVRR